MDDFTPAVQQAEPNTDMLAAGKLAEVAGDQRFIAICQQSAQLSVFQQFKTIETPEQYDQAIDAFDASKKAVKDLEALRHTVVDYPTKFIKLVNGLFKQIRDGLEVSKKHLGVIINSKKAADEEAAQAAIEEQKDQTDGEAIVNEDGVVQMGDEPILPPSNTVESARGAKVHTRKDIEVEIEDMTAFLKALVSKNARYGWFVSVKEELIEVKIGALKRLIKDNGGKKIPGVKVTKVTKTI